MAEDFRFPTAGGAQCAATLHRPEGVTSESGAPCVVLANGVSMTRRDGVDRFARAFADAGMAALTYDPRHLGDSDGEPRQLIDLRSQVEDLRAAVVHARRLEGVDGRRIALWGFSLGGGVALEVAVDDQEIAAVVLLCPMVDGLAFTLAGDLRNNARAALAAMRALRRAEHLRLPITGTDDGPVLFTQSEAAVGFDAVVGEGSSGRNEVLASPTRLVATFRPARRARELTCPLVVVVGAIDTVVPRRPAERVARRAPGGRLEEHATGHFGAFGEHFDAVTSCHVAFLSGNLALPPSEPDRG